jgi:hypothetical protein
MAFGAPETFPSMMQRAIENPQLAEACGIKVSRMGIFYRTNKSLNNWYSTVVGKKRAYGTAARSMINYGMKAKKMPHGSWFRRFPKEDFSLWKYKNPRMKAQVLSPHFMMLIDAAYMESEEASMQPEAASVQPEAVSVQPEAASQHKKVFLKLKWVKKEDAGYEVGI